MHIYPDLWDSLNKLFFLIIDYGSLWIINLTLITSVSDLIKNFLSQTCGLYMEFVHTPVPLHVRGFGIPYLPLRPGLAVTIWALIIDSWCLCDVCFVLYPSRIKSVSTIDSKFSNLEGAIWVVVLDFPELGVLSPGLLSCWSHQQPQTKSEPQLPVEASCWFSKYSSRVVTSWSQSQLYPRGRIVAGNFSSNMAAFTGLGAVKISENALESQ
jgi:hypothetical protein